MNNTDILKLFSYSSEEQQTFRYLRSYMRRIEPHLPQLLENPAKRDRFMLIGLFLTYRAFNHMGVTMTTDPEVLDDLYDFIHIRRLRGYHEATGKDIKHNLHYLRLIRFGPVKFISLAMGSGIFLYRFVVAG